jgi:hypothetical protein
MTEEIE